MSPFPGEREENFLTEGEEKQCRRESIKETKPSNYVYKRWITIVINICMYLKGYVLSIFFILYYEKRKFAFANAINICIVV